MFHAGAVIPSSVFLLQLLTPPGGDLGKPLEVREDAEPPVRVGLNALSAGGRESGLNVVEPPVVLFELGPLLRPKLGEVNELPLAWVFPPPVMDGLSGPPPPFLGPIVVGKFAGLTELATRLKAPRH